MMNMTDKNHEASNSGDFLLKGFVVILQLDSCNLFAYTPTVTSALFCKKKTSLLSVETRFVECSLCMATCETACVRGVIVICVARDVIRSFGLFIVHSRSQF